MPSQEPKQGIIDNVPSPQDESHLSEADRLLLTLQSLEQQVIFGNGVSSFTLKGKDPAPALSSEVDIHDSKKDIEASVRLLQVIVAAGVHYGVVEAQYQGLNTINLIELPLGEKKSAFYKEAKVKGVIFTESDGPKLLQIPVGNDGTKLDVMLVDTDPDTNRTDLLVGKSDDPTDSTAVTVYSLPNEFANSGVFRSPETWAPSALELHKATLFAADQLKSQTSGE